MGDDRFDAKVAKTGAGKPVASRAEIDSFLAKIATMTPTVAVGQRGRLVFALDATMSRQPTWDSACSLQAGMFQEAGSIGGLDVQLVYFRGLNECRSSGWVANPERLGKLMEKIDCRGGHTQIGKVLGHIRRECEKRKIQALVYVGDSMEESVDDLCAAAGELGLLGVPAFMFQEGHDSIAENAYREIARLSRGAYGRFAPGAAQELAELLRAAAAYAAGGMKALADLSRKQGGAQKLLRQMS